MASNHTGSKKNNPLKKANKGKIELEKAIQQLVNQYFENQNKPNQSANLHQELIRRVERELIKEILNKTNYNQSQTACILGISRTTLRNKITQLAITLDANDS